jgi:hypothetical protein
MQILPSTPLQDCNAEKLLRSILERDVSSGKDGGRVCRLVAMRSHKLAARREPSGYRSRELVETVLGSCGDTPTRPKPTLANCTDETQRFVHSVLVYPNTKMKRFPKELRCKKSYTGEMRECRNAKERRNDVGVLRRYCGGKGRFSSSATQVTRRGTSKYFDIDFLFCAHAKAKSGGISSYENRPSCNSDVSELLHGVTEKSWFSSSNTQCVLQVRVTVVLRRKEKLCVKRGARKPESASQKVMVAKRIA